MIEPVDPFKGGERNGFEVTPRGCVGESPQSCTSPRSTRPGYCRKILIARNRPLPGRWGAFCSRRRGPRDMHAMELEVHIE